VTARTHDATESASAAARGRIDVLTSLISTYAERPALQAQVAATDAVRYQPPTALTEDLAELAVGVPGLVSAWVSDERGFIIDNAAHTPANVGQDLSYRDWFQGARRLDGPYLSVGYVNRDAARTPGFAISVPVHAPGTTELAGVLAVSMRLDAFEAMFLDAVPSGGHLVITDQLGQVLAASGVQHAVLEAQDGDAGIRAALQGETTLTAAHGWLTVSAPLIQGWTISTSLPSSLATKPNDSLTRTLTIAGGTVALLLATLLLRLARLGRSRVRGKMRLAAALAEVEAHSRYTDTVLDTLDVAISVCDTDGRLTYYNRLSKQWHGLDADAEVDAEQWGDRYSVTRPDGSPLAADEWPLIRAMATGDAATDELLLRAPGQNERRFVARAQPLLAADGALLGAVVGSQDVTVLRAKEAELLAARDDATRAGDAKSAFLATMSHEIRTPLNAVLGLTDLLLTTGLTQDQRSHLEIIAGSGDSLLALINDVLDFSKIEAGELDLAPTTFDLHDLVYDVTQLLAGQIVGKGLHLFVEIPGDCPRKVIGDSLRLRQILLNLIGNAVKFTDEGAVVVRVRAELQGHRLSTHIAVSDTGIGIPDHLRHRLFRSFSQVDASTTRVYGGTGLGLAISQRIAHAMGGDISVDSEPGVGSTFTVTIELDLASSPDDGSAGSALAGRRLLLVDDNRTHLEILGRQLSGRGAACTLVAGPDEARSLPADGNRTFDAGIVTVRAEQTDVEDLARRLRACPPVGGLPLILISACMTLETQHSSPFVAQLRSPVHPDRLLDTLSTALERGTEGRSSGAGRPATDPPDLQVGRRRLRVLVAEDHPVNAQLMTMYLRQLGHDGEHVVNGHEAVTALAERGPYDVVLMDAQMPVLGGVDATAAIRELPGPQPRIIAVTAGVLASDRAAFFSAGADDFLSKPVRIATLAQAFSWDGVDRRTTSEPSDSEDLPPAGSRPLDAETVDELRDLGGDDFRHLCARYLDSLDSTVADLLATAADDGRWPARRTDGYGSVYRLAHRLKGSSAAMGALHMADLCRRVEESVAADRPAGQDDELDRMLAALTEESHRVREAVTELLSTT
jgi:signal transduction histidine kinase/DNA-binding response OmpR family regulator/HPt (histidine-containing phosphotransfer) domain-containing protein